MYYILPFITQFFYFINLIIKFSKFFNWFTDAKFYKIMLQILLNNTYKKRDK